MIAAYRHVLEAVTRHAEDASITRVAGGAATMARAVSLLDAHRTMLERRAEQLGGVGTMGGIKEAVTSVTGFLTGLYGQVRGETASRMFRDNYVAVNFLMVSATMLHTTGRVLGDAATVEVSKHLMRDLPPLLMEFQELVPRAVVLDLADDHKDLRLNTSGADHAAVVEVKNAWRNAAASNA